jgi:hypothetical protein
VATEENEVYAFNEKPGTQIWMPMLGEAVVNAAAVPPRQYLAAGRDRYARPR